MTIAKGLGAIADVNKGGANYLKLKDGESTVIRFIQNPEDIVSEWEYSIQVNGMWRNVTALPKDECLLFAAGKRAGFKSYLIVHDQADDKVKPISWLTIAVKDGQTTFLRQSLTHTINNSHVRSYTLIFLRSAIEELRLYALAEQPAGLFHWLLVL
ncbi:hypothetical protein QUF84_00140 [Fictibacillus enclensis]|nr:hypothetical protein [Fictibacillus enclensis]MDM5335705.1 hypothetical protein [Fictibacillus enclensis]